MSRRPLFPPVFAPTVSHPMVDDFTLRALRHQQKQSPGVPLGVTIPLRNHPIWSGNNELGIELPLSDVPVNSVFERTVLKLDEFGPPRVWTLLLGTNFDPAGDSTAATLLTALIEPGGGGTTQAIRADWINGTVLRLPMNSVSVKVRGFLGPAVTAGASIPNDIRVRVSLAEGDIGGLPPQLTREIIAAQGALDPSQTAAAVPPYAKQVKLSARSQAAADALFAAGNYLNFYPAKGAAVLASIRAQDALTYMDGGLPVPNGSAWLGFVNTTTPGDIRFWATFDLCL